MQIANTTNEARGNWGWAGTKLMAAREGCSTRTLLNGIRKLELQGYLKVIRRPGAPSLYQLQLDKIESLGVKSIRKDPTSALNPSSQAPASFGTNATPFTEVSEPTEYVSDGMSGRSRASANAGKVRLEIKDGNKPHNGRLRKDWDRELSYYRRKLNQGVERPFWPFLAGPRPTERSCAAPLDLMVLYDFIPQSTFKSSGSQPSMPRKDNAEISQT